MTGKYYTNTVKMVSNAAKGHHPIRQWLFPPTSTPLGSIGSIGSIVMYKRVVACEVVQPARPAATIRYWLASFEPLTIDRHGFVIADSNEIHQ